MVKQNHILYIEDDEDERNALSELITMEMLELCDIHISKVATFEEARAILQETQVDLILIDIHASSTDENHHIGLDLVNDPTYSSISKIVIMIDIDDRVNSALKGNVSMVGFSYRCDPQRVGKLVITLKKHLLL